MKVFALIITLAALYFSYRIAYPKQAAAKKRNDPPQPRSGFDVSEVVVKSRFVRPDAGQPQPTRTTPAKTVLQDEKPPIFAAGNEKSNAVIPVEKLDEVFDDFNPDELEIEPDEDNGDIRDNRDNWDEEFDEADSLEQGAELASGMSIEEMGEAAKAIDHPTGEKANILFKVEKTDMFEQMVSGDEGKAERIKAIIDRHFRSLQPEVEVENGVNDDELNKFDIHSHLAGRNSKK
jgi:hypothetical protein